MFLDIIKKAGLTGVQAEIYDFLLEHNDYKASDIARDIKRPRGVVYKGLEELIILGLTSKRDDKNMISRFSAEHPNQLEKLFNEKEKQALTDRKTFFSRLPELVSNYNLTHHKPGVKYFEGDEGIKKVTEDSLTAIGEIYTYLDTEKTMKYIAKLNEQYVSKREKLKIKKKILTTDNPFTRQYMKDHGQLDVRDDQLTQVKIINSQKYSFNTIMQIYNNKISYITLLEQRKLGVIIEDEHIAQMHKDIFLYNWRNAKTLKEILDEEKDYLSKTQ